MILNLLRQAFLLLLLLCTHNLAKGQVPNFPYSLPLFSDVLPVLSDSSKGVIGINHRLNDYKGFDGNVVQLGLRTKPFFGKSSFLSNLEAGLLVNGYFHQKYYWVHLYHGYGAILDQATAGHEVILFFNQTIRTGP
ncbi:hypothetical protein [Nafulsella turpanensis]|uniref:hypothetical protein n=1 Tax=Nafulsella turpanensis TaxID=1265690 RepID=UPI00034C1A56|nr:hypothetical protein [Nafulsella turpanensis]